MKICITGGAGFIGTNFTKYFIEHYDADITVIDKLTYAGNKDNLDGLDLKFVHKDICDLTVQDFDSYDYIFHFAAESMVDRSIHDATDFLRTNITGTVNLLELCKQVGCGKFIMISTDEVYGSVSIPSRETDIISCSSAYSASKAAAETFCNAYHKTFQIPIVITRSSNNFGPYQHGEKLIPKIIRCAHYNNPIPIYGTGMNIRDWIFVEDNCSAIDFVSRKGVVGEVYNIGGGNPLTNLTITKTILGIMGKPQSLINFVSDRPGHDFEYNLDCYKLKRLGWEPNFTFDAAIKTTVKWYLGNTKWMIEKS